MMILQKIDFQFFLKLNTKVPISLAAFDKIKSKYVFIFRGMHNSYLCSRGSFFYFYLFK